METTVSQRMQLLLATLGLTQREFARRVALDPSYISHIIAKNRLPGRRVVESICREFSVRETWLRTGEGEMLQSPASQEALAAFCGRVLAQPKDSPQRRALEALSRLSPVQCAQLMDLLVLLSSKTEKNGKSASAT